MRQPVAFSKSCEPLVGSESILRFVESVFLGWDVEAMLSDSGILLQSPVLQWDLEFSQIKYTELKVFPWHQDPNS